MKSITLLILIAVIAWLAPLGTLAQDATVQQAEVPPPPQTSTAPPQQQVIVVEQGSAQQQQYAPVPVQAQPVPETRVRLGLVIAGAVLFGVSYVFHALLVSPLAGVNFGFGSTDVGQWNDFRTFGAIPLVGPWIQLAVKPTAAFEDSWATYLAIDAILQTAGVAMFVLGFVLRKETNAYADTDPSIHFGPMIGQNAAGLTASGRF